MVKSHLDVLVHVETQAAQAWSVIYKTLYESLTRFYKLLENGPRYKIIRLSTLLLLCFYAFWVFLGHFKRCLSFDQKITRNAPETPRTHKNTTTISYLI